MNHTKVKNVQNGLTREQKYAKMLTFSTYCKNIIQPKNWVNCGCMTQLPFLAFKNYECGMIE